TSAWGCRCPLSLSLALSSSETAVFSVLPGGLLSFTHQLWHRLFWQFQNLPVLKPCAGIANLHANLDVGYFYLINPEVKAGGRFAPKDCIALQKVAIIIPFRNREEHLKYWLYYLHPILQRQQLDYGVYVINQDGEEEFNRAKLLNIGFAEALKEYDYDCFVFSDVDLIPMDDRNTYKCYSQPRHLSVSMDKFGFRLPYNQYFGGVSALSKEQFTKINGFPNNYWGWGGEDDDIYNRLVFKGMGISRPDAVIGKCRMIRHSRDRKNEPNPERCVSPVLETMSSDGLNTLSYKVLRTDKYPLYTKITLHRWHLQKPLSSDNFTSGCDSDFLPQHNNTWGF
uniref:Beta-1,4-galactosyltransferase n=1 Tax=Otus sunia TaxID=257818 RepID=A0A8C8EAD6_9STRI